jgi:hypothetical protein
LSNPVESFQATTPSLENYWRAAILFGRNVASYKFALGSALLEIGPRDDTLVRLEELAVPFARHLTRHLKLADKQATSPSSRFLEACRRFNAGELAEEELGTTTTRLGFVNVIDAFHVVNQKELPVRFFVDERRTHGAIRLTDEFHGLLQGDQARNLPGEVEARWRLVETAWDLDLSRSLVGGIAYDPQGQDLLARTPTRRVSVTSCRDALNGYQKGWCFYCFDRIGVGPTDPDLADVDHFFAHALKRIDPGGNLDGVWNLVLACQTCNRGPAGKFARVPSLGLLARLHGRNEYLIASHHPLRETLIRQTGATEPERRAFLQARHTTAVSHLVHTWAPETRQAAAF